MTSANFYSGYAIDKPTSKVLNPPGGRSNNIFDCTDDQAKNPQPRKENPQTKTTSQPLDESTSNVQAKKRTGYNPITGQCYDEPTPKASVPKEAQKPQEQKSEPISESKSENSKQQETGYHPRQIHTSSKVLQPPGGASTKLW